MKTSSHLQRSLVLFGGGLLLVAAAASARTVPALGGRPASDDFSCFRSSQGSVSNSCSTAQTYDIPLTVNNVGAKSVFINAFGASAANNVCCSVVAVNSTATVFSGSASLCLPSFGAVVPIQLSGATVETNGYLSASCTVQPGGRIHNAGWND
jgi:hypothetical protein